MSLDLDATTEVCRLLGEPTRVRLLALLAEEELTVAELVEVTGLPQPRVSTHLGKLKDAGLVRDRREGSFSWYSLNLTGMSGPAALIWQQLRGSMEDPLLKGDLDRAAQVIRARAEGQPWADAVAGAMERHYAPGRTWESLARALPGLLHLGSALDIASGDGAVAELIAPHAASVTCLDISERVVTAGRRRLGHLHHVRFVQGDMHQLPFPDRIFDQVLLLNALSYTEDPARVLAEAARVLKPGGQLTAIALNAHEQRDAARPYGHVNSGFAPDALRYLAQRAGFVVSLCGVTSREHRTPHFEVLTLHATRSPS